MDLFTLIKLMFTVKGETMITESNFFDYRGDKGVAISVTVPRWYKGRRYHLLAPTSSLLFLWKNGHLEEDDYLHLYHADVLSRLDKEKIRKDLGEDAVLLCWERTGFCHRHIVVDWLNGKGLLDEV